MSQQVDTGTRRFVAGEAIPQFSVVTYVNTGKVLMCDLTDQPIGVAQQEAFADGDPITVKLFNAPGTFKVRANEACAIDAVLYTEAGGYVQDTAQATSLPVGIALEAAGAQNDIIEMLPLHYGGLVAT